MHEYKIKFYSNAPVHEVSASSLTQEIKPYTALITLDPDHYNIVIDIFLNLTKSFVFRLRQEFMVNYNQRQRIKYCQWSDAIQAVEFFQ